MFVIYLCGPMTGKTPEDASAWRDYTRDELEPLGFRTTSPLRVESTFLAPKKKIPVDAFDEKHEIPELRPTAIYQRDMFDVRNADLILANMSDAKIASLGSSHELGYADALRKMIILVAQPGNIYREHPIVAQASGLLFGTLEPALAYIKLNYAPYVDREK